MLLALDPGMNSPGVALFDTGRLRYAAQIEIPRRFADMPLGARWMHVAMEIVRSVQDCGRVDTVVFEKPQIYSERQGKSKGDPNQLISVAGVAANVTGILYHPALPIDVLSPTPGEWIGQLPKVCQVCKGKAKKRCKVCEGSAWKTPRGVRIRSRLTTDELALVPDQNDAIDAVGIGLWASGRLERHVVFSNGRDGR